MLDKTDNKPTKSGDTVSVWPWIIGQTSLWHICYLGGSTEQSPDSLVMHKGLIFPGGTDRLLKYKEFKETSPILLTVYHSYNPTISKLLAGLVWAKTLRKILKINTEKSSLESK